MTALWLAASGVLMLLVFAKLHAVWAPIPWLACMALCLAFFASQSTRAGEHSDPPPRAPREVSFLMPWGVALVLVVAALLRLHRIHELPLGPYVDEIQTLRNALALSSEPFDFFASRPLVRDDWVHTSNAYLSFDWLILKLCGVSYFSMKLFSVIPGILTCLFFTRMCQMLFAPRIALATGLFFAVGHWPVRLSRYGWDAAFSLMFFAAALWLLLLARERRQAVWACASGLLMGLGLYGYLGARVSALSLGGVLLVDWALKRDRAARERIAAFAAGIAAAAFPLLLHYLEAPSLVWLRAAELSIFSRPESLSIFLENLLGHVGMFHVTGGAYARDNLPGVPMLDGVSGLLMLVGLWVLVRHRWRDIGWIAVLLLVCNWLGGLFSVSQEGPPYVYRTAGVMLPAFLMVGFGAEAIDRIARSGRFAGFAGSAGRRFVIPVLLAAAVAWNLHLYFGLEARSTLAARVMAYEARLVVDEVRDTELPVYVVGADTLAKRRVLERPTGGPSSPFLELNPTFRFSPGYSLLAVEYLSGRRQASGPAGDPAVGVTIVDTVDFATVPIATPSVLLFRPGGEGEIAVRARFPAARVRYVDDVRGSLALGVATLEGSATTARP